MNVNRRAPRRKDAGTQRFPIFLRAFAPLRLCATLCLVLALALAALEAARASADPRAKLAPALATALADGETPMLVFFAGSAEVGAAPAIRDRAERRGYVYDQLRTRALDSQAVARILLERRGAPYRPHYLVNAMEVTGDAALATALAALPEVTRLIPVTAGSARLPVPQPSDGSSQPQAVAGVEWGVQRIHAPEVWSLYGTQGVSVVIGIADTGVKWDHPALQPQYRGWDGVTATHTLNWHDAVHQADGIGTCSAPDNLIPCDGYGHGTHVTGIAAGDDHAGNQIGVAPGSRWIGCRNMNNAGVGSIPRYIECFEFMLAPYPQFGDPLLDGHPELGADIVNNSWTCTSGEGCTPEQLNALLPIVQNSVAAGMLVVAAAGNAGPSCSTVAEPLGIYAPALSVGAIVSGTDALASFSSRGPVAVDGSNRRKPDISAPGAAIRSSTVGGGYGNNQGTSMASPHVAGAAALLWSAVPTVAQNVNLTTILLEASADARTSTQGCGGDALSAVPNNGYGYGIVNVLAAVQMDPAAAVRIAGNRFFVPIVLAP